MWEVEENGRFYYLLAQWHSRAQGGGEGNNFGDSRAERQIFFQNNASQNRFHLWNSRACELQPRGGGKNKQKHEANSIIINRKHGSIWFAWNNKRLRKIIMRINITSGLTWQSRRCSHFTAAQIVLYNNPGVTAADKRSLLYIVCSTANLVVSSERNIQFEAVVTQNRLAVSHHYTL